MEDPGIQYSLYVSGDIGHSELNLESAQVMKSVHLILSIVQEAFCPKILLFHWQSADAHHPLGRSCFLDSLEAWEAKISKPSFVHLVHLGNTEMDM